jgi:diguanylate cyclase (GGDEF)-like protein
MNLGQLEFLINEIRRVSFADDKTPLGTALALAQEEQLINEASSEFNVIVFGDLNDFKQLNDNFGYVAGDVAIKQVGETILEVIVKDLQAKAFRQSGDEFVILLKEDSVERFLSVTHTFSDISITHLDQKLRTAMSFGLARGDDKTSFRELQGRAEIACK